jgi:hypothetical protein
MRRRRTLACQGRLCSPSGTHMAYEEVRERERAAHTWHMRRRREREREREKERSLLTIK